jgi:hypothetical protein
MNDQTPRIVRPVEKTPTRKLYLYRQRICSECGLLHLYRKFDEEKSPAAYGCGKYYQPWLLGEEAEIKQERLF